MWKLCYKRAMGQNKKKKANLDTLTAKPQTTSRWAKRAEYSPFSFPKIQNLADLIFTALFHGTNIKGSNLEIVMLW